MVSKNNRKLIAEKNRKNEKQRFALRKLNVGVASVLLGITFSVYGGGQLVAHADTTPSIDQANETATTNEETLADKSQVTLDSSAADTNSSAAANTATQTSNNNNLGGANSTVASDTPKSSEETVKSTDNGATAGSEKKAAEPATTSEDNNGNQTGDVQKSEQGNTQELSVSNKSKSSAVNPSVFLTSLVQTNSDATDESSITVTDAKGLVDAIQNGTATTINIANNISLGDLKRGGNAGEHGDRIKNKRDIVIQSADNNKYIVDFNNYAFTMNDQSHSVTFKNLDLYSRSWFGLLQSAGTYNFDDINYHGPQMIYSKVDSVINYSGTVNAETVSNYTYDGKPYTTQRAEEIIEFRGGRKGTVNFTKDSNVTLSTINGMVMYLEGTGSSVNVADGATVNINPHYTGANGEFYDGVHGIGIYVKNGADINVNQGGKLIINTEKGANDKEVSGGIYLNGNSTINVENGGNLTFNSNGQLSSGTARNPLTINGSAKINVGNEGTLAVNATNLGSYSGSLINAGTGTVNLAAHSNFSVSGDGSGDITAINLSGGKFTSDQPGEFNIDLSKNTGSKKALIQNGTINFTRVKTKLADGQESAPIKSIQVTFKNGVPTVDSIVGPNETGVKNVVSTLTNPDVYKSTAYFTASGEDVNIKSVELANSGDSKQITGNVTSESGNGDIYVNITIKNGDGSTITLPTTASVDQYTVNSDGNSTTKVNYTTKTDKNGNFTVPLVDANGKAITLTNGATITVNATKNYVDAAPDTIKYNPADKTELKKAINEASTVENSDAYKNADSDLQKAYTDAIKAGQNVDSNDLATEKQVSTALTNITNAKDALNGMANPTDNKLNTTTDSTTGTKTTTLTGKAEAGSTVTAKKSDGTVIGTAQVGDDGTYSIVIPQTDVNGTDIKVSVAKDGKKSGDVSVETSVNKTALTNDVKGQSATHNDPSYINGSEEAKKAYDDAVTAGQKVLNDENASQADVDKAAKAIEDAKGNLKGEATNKDALKSAIDEQPTTQDSAKYKNSSEASQKAYDDAVAAGQKVYDNPTASQTEVDKAKQDIEAAKAALDGKDTDKTALTNDVKGQSATHNDPSYINGSEEAKKAYDDAVTAGQKVLNDENASQADVDKAAKAIEDAKGNLKGEATNKDALKSAIDEQPTTQDSAKYKNSSEASQKAYDDAVAAGQKVYDNPTASQTEVDKAKQDIEAAKAALDGKDTDKTALTNDVKGQSATHNDPSYINGSEEAKKAYDDAVTAGQKVLNDENASQADVDKAAKAIEDAKGNLKGEATNKDALKSAIDEQPTTQDSAKYKNSSEASQKAYDDAVAAGQKVYDNPTASQTEVDKAKQDIEAAKAALDGKDTDKTALTNDVKGQSATHNDPSYINGSEEAKKAYDDAVTAGQKVLNDENASQADVDKAAKAIEDAKGNLNGIANLHHSQAVAKSNLNDAAEKAKQTIDAQPNLTPEQKQAAKDDVDKAAKTANDAIDKATTTDDVDKATNDGLTNIDKAAAKAAVQNALNKKAAEIKDASSLTNDEQAALEQKAQKFADDAFTAIDNAKDVTTVDASRDEGIANINSVEVPTASPAKDAANHAIDDALKAKINEINKADNLTEPEKDALKKEANDRADKAKDNIAKATTDADVVKATTDGVNDIADVKVPSLEDAKKDAIDIINDTLKQKTAEIDGATNLTDPEKDALKKEAKDAADDAISKINDAKTNDAVKEERDTGVQNIENVTIPSLDDAKSDATKVIDQVLAEKTAEINKADHLSDSEKNALIKEATDFANDAKDKINKATTNDAVKNAETKGVQDILGVKVPGLDDHKKNAIDALDAAKKDKNTEIDNASHLSTAEKDALKKQVEDEYTKAVANVNNAKTNDAVDAARDTGVQAILDIKVPSLKDAQQNATDAINQVRNVKKEAIDNAKNLTDSEKDALKKQVDDIADDAINKINTAKTNDEAKNAETTGINDILNLAIPSLDDAKSDAKQAVTDALNTKTAEINAATYLTNDKKQALLDGANKDAETAYKNIDAATTNKAADDAAKDGVQTILNIKVPSLASVQQDAIDAINEELANKKAQINAANISDTAKDALIKEATDAANKAIEAVKSAATASEISSSADDGITTIKNINLALQTAKDNAIKAIDDALNAKKAEINATNLAPAEETELTNQAKAAADTAKEEINAATTEEAVADAQSRGVAAIEAIEVPTASQDQTDDNTPTTDTTEKNSNEGKQEVSQNTKVQNDHMKVTASVANTHNGQKTTNANKQATLPQTGNEANRGMSLAGLAVAGLVGLVGLAAKFGKKNF